MNIYFFMDIIIIIYYGLNGTMMEEIVFNLIKFSSGIFRNAMIRQY